MRLTFAFLVVMPFVAVAAGPVVVPLRIVDNFPVIAARIQGREVTLMYNLGSDARLALSDEVLSQISTRPAAGAHRWADAKGNVLESPLYTVPVIDIGGLEFREVTGHVQRSDPSYPAPKTFGHGMIGEPFFHGYKIVLDYAGERITLIPDDYADAEAAGCAGTKVPFLADWAGSPVTRATTDLGELVLVWDTGAPVSIVRRSLALERGADGTRKTHVILRFELGGTDFGPLELRLFDFTEPRGADGFVGHSFFAAHVVCMDMSNRLVRVRRS